MSADDKEYMPFYRTACDALNAATQKVRAKGTKLSQIDRISALTMAHLRVAAMAATGKARADSAAALATSVLLAERPEIDPAIFDGEMTKHVSRAAKQIADYNDWKHKAVVQ
jgi:hypothetical protein